MEYSRFIEIIKASDSLEQSFKAFVANAEEKLDQSEVLFLANLLVNKYIYKILSDIDHDDKAIKKQELETVIYDSKYQAKKIWGDNQ